MLSSHRYNAGTVHYLDFDEYNPMGSEMVKGRGVVIVSPAPRRDPDLVIVVPLSLLEPVTHKKHAVRIMHSELNGRNGGSWAKCDMPMTVSISRLLDYRRPKYAGQNHVPVIRINTDTLNRIRTAMFRAIGGREMLARERKDFLARVEARRPKRIEKKVTLIDRVRVGIGRRQSPVVNRPV